MLLKLLKGSFGKMEFPEDAPEPAATSPAPLAPPAAGGREYEALFPGAADRSVVIIIFGPSRSNPFKSVSEWLVAEFRRRGLHCHPLNLWDAVWPNPPFESLFFNNKVRYGLSWGGVGSNLDLVLDGKGRNIWDMHKVPLFKIMGDHPAYFLDLHVSPQPVAVNLYGFAEHRDFFLRHVRPNRGYGGLVPLSRIEYLPPEELDFEAKKNGKILFLKNGNDPENLRELWRERLPASTATLLLEMAEELRAGLPRESAFNIEEVVTARFARLGVDVANKTVLLSYYIAQLDDYLRRVKSTMIARALLEFPVEVHGECWEHIDFSGKRAKLIPYGDYVRSSQLIRDGLCVIDMSPNTFSAPHERFIRSASRHTLCLTNRSPFLEQTFGPLGQPLFDFTPDSIRESVAAVLADPERHVGIGRRVGEAYAQLAPVEALFDFFETMADQVRMEQGKNPDVQPFVAWPPSMLQRP